MIWCLLLLFPINFCESAIFYVKENDKNDELSNLQFFKLLGLNLNTKSDTLKNDFSKMVSGQVHNEYGNYDESEHVPVKFTLAVDKNGIEQGPDVINIFDYTEGCKSLVGTSSIPLCQMIKKNQDGKKNLPRSCQEILESGGNKSGIYQIHPRTSSQPFSVLCDMETKDGGWTHIQRRFDGSQDFYLQWREYKFGFGDLNGEFWIGLENIHHMTGFETNELLIELTDREQKKAYAQYSLFSIGAEKEGYSLKDLKGFSGDAGDALTQHLGMKFSTNDVDQDSNSGNCASMYSGAWWYKSCYESNLNGKYMNKQLSDPYKYHGLHWNGFKGKEYMLAGSRMLIRPLGVK